MQINNYLLSFTRHSGYENGLKLRNLVLEHKYILLQGNTTNLFIKVSRTLLSLHFQRIINLLTMYFQLLALLLNKIIIKKVYLVLKIVFLQHYAEQYYKFSYKLKT